MRKVGCKARLLCLSFGVARPGQVTLDVFDVVGRRVRSLVRASVPSGVHHREWDGRDEQGREAAAGLYFVKLQVREVTLVQKVVALK